MTVPSPQRTGLPSLLAGLTDPVILALGVTQTIGYGSLYYAYGVLAPAMAADFGVGLDWIFFFFAAGLLVSGLASPLIGRQLDRLGARPVLASGSVLVALALLIASQTRTIWAFGGAVVLIELVGCMVLYDSAFAALTQIHRHRARLAITQITLIAGFASTIFWPMTQTLLAQLGWRGTFAAYSAAHLAICLPLHLSLLKGAKPLPAAEPAGVAGGGAAAAPPVLEGEARSRAFRLLALAICLSGFAYSAFPVHMIRIIQSEGFTAEAAALIAMVMGPMQVLARIVEILAGHRFDAMMSGRAALGGLVASVLLLMTFSGMAATAVLFVALYGASQGLITIARGTIPLQLFGPRGYGAIVGRITGLRLVVTAAAPFLFAVISTRFGIAGALAVSGMLAAAAFVALILIRPPKR